MPETVKLPRQPLSGALTAPTCSPCLLSPHTMPGHNREALQWDQASKGISIRPLEINNDSKDLGVSSGSFPPCPPSFHDDPQGLSLLDEKELDKGGGCFPPGSPDSHPQVGGVPLARCTVPASFLWDPQKK